MTFEYIDCKEKLILPLLYQALIELKPDDNIEEYSQFIYKKYFQNEEIKKLFEQIKSIMNIPIKLLSKYYCRLYTINSNFYQDINKELRENKKENYLIYIKMLYEGIKLKSLPLSSNNVLYRGSKISKNEIQKIKDYLGKKIDGLPGAIVFSKSFLPFSKDKEQAQEFLKDKNKNENLCKVLYTIEKDEIIDFNLATHSDIEQISKYPEEKEVLFFPFSSFEIKEIKESQFINESNNNNEEILYEIKLLYLGKYVKEIENMDDIKIPESEFKNEMKKMGLIPEKKWKKLEELLNNIKKIKF